MEKPHASTESGKPTKRESADEHQVTREDMSARREQRKRHHRNKKPCRKEFFFCAGSLVNSQMTIENWKRSSATGTGWMGWKPSWLEELPIWTRRGREPRGGSTDRSQAQGRATGMRSGRGARTARSGRQILLVLASLVDRRVSVLRHTVLGIEPDGRTDQNQRGPIHSPTGIQAGGRPAECDPARRKQAGDLAGVEDLAGGH
jgi:hypothetical protein